METNQGLQIAQRSRRRVLRPDLPHDLHCLLGDDKDHGATIIGDDVVRVKALVTLIIPLVGAHVRCGVEKHAVLTPAPVHDGLLGRLAVLKFFKMLRWHPFPTDVALPINLDDTGGSR